MDTREQLINTLQLSYETVKMHEEERQRYAQKNNKVATQQQLIKDCKDAKGAKSVAKIFSAFAVILSVPVCQAIMENKNLFNLVGIALMILSLVVPVVVAYQLLVKFIVNPMARKKARPLEEQLIPLKEDLAKAKENLDLALSLEREGGIAHTFPPQYQTTKAVSFMLEAVQCMRADSLKEAFSLYDEKEHRTKMEQGQRQILNEQQELKKAVEEAQRSATAAVNAAEHATWVAYSNSNQ